MAASTATIPEAAFQETPIPFGLLLPLSTAWAMRPSKPDGGITGDRSFSRRLYWPQPFGASGRVFMIKYSIVRCLLLPRDALVRLWGKQG